MLKNKYTLLLVVIMILSLSSNLLAASSGKNAGLGNDFVTITGGDALYANPAAVNANQDVFLLELNLAADFWNNLLSNQYYDESEKDKLLKKVKDGFLVGTEGNGGAKMIIGPVAIMLESRANGLVDFTSDAAELFLKGNEIDRNYNLASQGSGAVYADAGVNFSIRALDEVIKEWDVKDLHVGFTYHQLAGVIFDIEQSASTEITYDDQGKPTLKQGAGEVLVKYNQPEELGDLAMGSAFDIGAYANLDDRHYLGFSVMNIGALTVDEYYQTNYRYNEEIGEFEEVGDSTTAINEELHWKLPLIIRLGAKREQTEYLDLFADYSYTKYNHGEQDHKFATAAELNWLKIIPLRTGLNYSTMRKDLNWSAGLGLDLGPLEADLGISDLLGFFNKSQGVEASLTAKIVF